MMLSEISKAVGGQLIGHDVGMHGVLCESVGSDSRNIVKSQLFVAIKGEHFDGNSFATEAIKQGAAAVLVSDLNTQASPAVLVQDTRLALGQMAKYWRDKFQIPLVAITGSNGKTTVKEMLAAILKAADKNALATQGNLNNDIGMPMTLLKLRAEHDVAVIEMGMNHMGEIDYLTHIAQPNIAVINNAGTAHIGELGSRDNIAKAKGEIFAGLSDDGVAVINADDEYADYWKSLNKNTKTIMFGMQSQADLSATFVEKESISEVTLYTPKGNIVFNLAMLGKHNISNALAASACAVALGVSNADIARGLESFTTVKGRLQRKIGVNGAALIDDTYNANPDSMKAAIDVLAAMQNNTIFVMGDMAELGADAMQMHIDIGAYAKQKGIQTLFTFGENSQLASQAFGANAQHFASIDSLVTSLKLIMQANTTLLVKGSRFMQMERVIQLIELNSIEEKSITKKMMEDA